MKNKIIVYFLMFVLMIVSASALLCPGGEQAVSYTNGHVCYDSIVDGSYSCQGTIYVCSGTFYDDYYCALGDSASFVTCVNGCDESTGLCNEGFRDCNEGFMRCGFSWDRSESFTQKCIDGDWKDVRYPCPEGTTCTESSSTYAFCEPDEPYRTERLSCLRTRDSTNCEASTNERIGFNWYKCYDSERECGGVALENKKNLELEQGSACKDTINNLGLTIIAFLIIPFFVLIFFGRKNMILGFILFLLVLFLEAMFLPGILAYFGYNIVLDCLLAKLNFLGWLI